MELESVFHHQPIDFLFIFCSGEETPENELSEDFPLEEDHDVEDTEMAVETLDEGTLSN